MIQSSIDVENLIENDLAQSMAIAIDDAALEVLVLQVILLG